MNIDDYPADAMEWAGVRYKTILPRTATGGAMSIVDSIAPVGSGPPRHIHETEDETFVIVDGRCKFWLNGETVIRGPGESVFVPRGTEHTYQVVGDRPSRHLVILTPGGFEGFFEAMAAGRLRIPEDLAAIEETGRRFNLRFTGPPLPAEA